MTLATVSTVDSPPTHRVELVKSAMKAESTVVGWVSETSSARKAPYQMPPQKLRRLIFIWRSSSKDSISLLWTVLSKFTIIVSLHASEWIVPDTLRPPADDNRHIFYHFACGQTLFGWAEESLRSNINKPLPTKEDFTLFHHNNSAMNCKMPLM